MVSGATAPAWIPHEQFVERLASVFGDVFGFPVRVRVDWSEAS